MALTAGFTAHWDASTTARLWTATNMSGTPNDGDAVRAWDDDGDAADHALFDATGVGAAIVPVYRAAAFNGFGCLDFDGTDDYLIARNDANATGKAISNFITNSAYTIFVSFIMEGDATNSASAYSNTMMLRDTAGYIALALRTNAGVHTLTNANWDGNEDNATVTIDQNTKYVATMRHESGNLYLSINQGTENSVASGNTQVVTGTLEFGRGLSSRHFNGKIGEVVFYNTALTGSALTDSYQFLMDKWVNAAGLVPVISAHVGAGRYPRSQIQPSAFAALTASLAETIHSVTSLSRAISGGTLTTSLAETTHLATSLFRNLDGGDTGVIFAMDMGSPPNYGFATRSVNASYSTFTNEAGGGPSGGNALHVTHLTAGAHDQYTSKLESTGVESQPSVGATRYHRFYYKFIGVQDFTANAPQGAWENKFIIFGSNEGRVILYHRVSVNHWEWSKNVDNTGPDLSISGNDTWHAVQVGVTSSASGAILKAWQDNDTFGSPTGQATVDPIDTEGWGACGFGNFADATLTSPGHVEYYIGAYEYASAFDPNWFANMT